MTHILVITSALLATSALAQRKTVRLTVGQSFTIRVKETITKVQVIHPNIADVADYTSNSATVIGMDGGTTEILVKTPRRTYSYAIVVTRVEVGRLFKQVQSFLGPIRGIYLKLFGDSIVLGGYALTADDYAKAARAVKIFGNKVRNLVQFKPSAVDHLNRILERSGLTEVKARLVGGNVFIEGGVGSTEEMEMVKAIIRTYGLKAENLVKIGGGKQVLVDVQFIEANKTALDSIGVKWPTRLGAGTSTGNLGFIQGNIPVSGGGSNTIDVSLNAPLSPAQVGLNLLVSKGRARLLARPRLVCGSGKKAEFLVGGQVPVVTILNNVVNVTWKEFGIKLKITPTADSRGNISSQIYAEISEPDESLKVLEVPGFRARKFDTFVTVKEGTSIVLSGLLANSDEKAVAKFPLLGSIPILGELFKSRDFNENKTMLAVFVTPRVVHPKHPWVEKTIRNIQKLYEDYEGEVGWRVFD